LTVVGRLVLNDIVSALRSLQVLIVLGHVVESHLVNFNHEQHQVVKAVPNHSLFQRRAAVKVCSFIHDQGEGRHFETEFCDVGPSRTEDCEEVVLGKYKSCEDVLQNHQDCTECRAYDDISGTFVDDVVHELEFFVE
jgi:hypothetical protein